MTLTLRAVSLNDRPLTQPITAHFDAEGGSVGRGDHNTLALPDPERHISRQHAEISVSGTAYRIKNVGSSNPITVGGRTLARGDSAPLGHHDQVRIGGYLLEVVQDDAPDAEADTVVRGRAAVDAATPGVDRRTPLPARAAAGAVAGLAGELGAPLSRDNPFADLLGDPFAAAAAAPSTPPARALLPDDFDPFALPPAGAPAAPPAAPVATADPFADLLPGGAAGSIDDLLGLQPGARDPLENFLAAPLPGADGGIAPPLDSDPLALFGAPTPRAPSGPTRADRWPELHAAYAPPAFARDQAGAGAPVPVPAAAPAPASARTPAPAPAALPAPGGDPAQELWAAFCEGAGVAVVPRDGVDAALMRHAGSLLRASVAGTLQLMAVRATAKHELRAEVTVIQARNNNPLKFSPDARSALEQMLQPPLRGFLAGPEAMTDAMHDLVGHAIGTMAGTRAALAGVLERFTPSQLEAKLSSRSVLDSVLPLARKARLWELYLQHFEAIRGEAQDDFHSLFGRAFLAAYEQQLARLAHDLPDSAG